MNLLGNQNHKDSPAFPFPLFVLHGNLRGADFRDWLALPLWNTRSSGRLRTLNSVQNFNSVQKGLESPFCLPLCLICPITEELSKKPYKVENYAFLRRLKPKFGCLKRANIFKVKLRPSQDNLRSVLSEMPNIDLLSPSKAQISFIKAIKFAKALYPYCYHCPWIEVTLFRGGLWLSDVLIAHITTHISL